MNLLSTKFVDISKFRSTQSTWVIVVCTYDWNVSSSMYLAELVDARVMNGWPALSNHNELRKNCIWGILLIEIWTDNTCLASSQKFFQYFQHPGSLSEPQLFPHTRQHGFPNLRGTLKHLGRLDNHYKALVVSGMNLIPIHAVLQQISSNGAWRQESGTSISTVFQQQSMYHNYM